jgi:hypothetical protein
MPGGRPTQARSATLEAAPLRAKRKPGRLKERDQVTETADARVVVTFNKVPGRVPGLAGPNALDHINSHDPVSYPTADRAGFHDAKPGRTIATEAIRGVLVRHGIRPRGHNAGWEPAAELDYRLCCTSRTMRISRTPSSTWTVPSATKPCLR